LGTLDSGGVTRTYRLYVPAAYTPDRPAALVLNLHGFGSNARQHETYSHMTQQAETSGFVTVAPDGTNSPQRWYIYGSREPGYVDDFAFLSALIDDLSARLCIDLQQVYATGISNGAGMSSLAACRLYDKLAAIAPVAGSPYSALECRGKGPVPVIAFHGTEDQLVPFEGGPGGRLGLPTRSVRDNMLNWAKHNGCDLTLSSERVAADVVVESYGGCRNGADVRLYVVEGGGHTWPGANLDVAWLGETTHSIDATALLWDFFAAHPKP
jgi:polyhydroxybutyrate depolymerase